LMRELTWSLEQPRFPPAYHWGTHEPGFAPARLTSRQIRAFDSGKSLNRHIA
jgi:hypothetical protein